MLFTDLNHTPNRLLIVDDESANLVILEEALKELGTIKTVGSGEEALAAVDSFRPHVILLDIEMPGMNGFEVCRRIKQNPQTRDIAVIFVTSHGESEFESYSLEHGGIDFISKPIDFRLCKLRVNNQLMLWRHTEALKTAKEDLHELVSHLPVFISYWSPEWTNLFSNDFVGAWFGVPAEKSLETHARDLLPALLWEELDTRCKSAGDESSSFTVHIDQPESELEDVQVYLAPRVFDNEILGYTLTLVDITAVKRVKKDLFTEKERLKVTLNSIGDAVIATDLEANVTFMNPIAERMTGWVSKEAIGEHIDRVMDLRDAYTQQLSLSPIALALKEQRIVAMALNSQLTSRDGMTYRVEDSAAPIRDDSGEVIGAIIVFHDVSESVAMAVKMSYLANHDQLTGLPNRVLLHDRLQHACKISLAKGMSVAVLLIDVDHFKYINDSLGHHNGDILINQVGKRLESVVDPNSTLARVGGDEFILVLPEVSNHNVVEQCAKSIVHGMQEPFHLEGKEYKLTVSVGISLNPTDATTEESLMRHSDVAMYRAKQQGRNCYCYFSEDLEAEQLKRHEVESLLRVALDRDALEMHFQPQIELSTGRLFGAEALVRIRDNEGQLVSPLQFIPLAEEIGLIHQLGEQVLMKSCLAAKSWRAAGSLLRVSVNVSALQFANPGFCDLVANILEKSGLSSEYLELEVTESALMLDFDQAKKTLRQLSSMGVSIAIDDFGTGYSSLSYLKLFSVHVLKIDQSFVRDMLSDSQSLDIVRTIVNLAKSLNMTLIAEGIEEEGQKRKLLELGCEMGQGYFYSRPLPEKNFAKYLGI